MTTATKPQRTVDVTVKSKAEESDGWKLELDIPSFQSKFPTTMTRVPAKLADQLRPGRAYKVNLEVQKLKKEGLDTSKPYNYYFGLLGLAGTQLATKEAADAWDGTAPEPHRRPQAAQGGTSSPNGAREWREAYRQGQEAFDAERASIERQTSLKVAAELLQSFLVRDDTMTAQQRIEAAKKMLPELTHIAHASLREIQEA